MKIKITNLGETVKPSRILEGATNADCTWKKGWRPKLPQCYIRKEAEGVYTFVHALNTINYAVIVSLIRIQGSISIIKLEKDSFSLSIYDINKNPMDADFRFMMSIIDD